MQLASNQQLTFSDNKKVQPALNFSNNINQGKKWTTTKQTNKRMQYDAVNDVFKYLN